jgi:hypothetical protein
MCLIYAVNFTPGETRDTFLGLSLIFENLLFSFPLSLAGSSADMMDLHKSGLSESAKNLASPPLL